MPRPAAALVPVGTRKSTRFMPYDRAGATQSESAERDDAERCLNDAADASAWLLEDSALFADAA